RDLKVIVTSATIDTARFSRHFGDAPVVEVAGRTYPVEVRYRPPGGDATAPGEQPRTGAAPEPSRAGQARRGRDGRDADPLADIAAAIDEITTEDPRGDVLVFLPGERE